MWVRSCRLATRISRLCGSAYGVLGPGQDALGSRDGLLILRFRDPSAWSWITTPNRILRQIRCSIEFLRPGEPGIFHKRDESGKVMRVRKNKALLDQNGLYTFFGSLLYMETQHCQEDFRGTPLLGKGEVAPGMTEPVLGATGRRRIRRHRLPCPHVERGNTPD